MGVRTVRYDVSAKPGSLNRMCVHKYRQARTRQHADTDLQGEALLF